MRVSGRRAFVSIGILLAVILIVGLCGIVGFSLLRSRLTPAPSANSTVPVVTAAPSDTPELDSTPSLAQTLPPSATIPPEIAAQMTEIEQQVVSLRGLQKAYSVPRVLISRDELRNRMSADLVQDYTPAEQKSEQILMTSLGVLSTGIDLRSTYLDLLSENVSGFYDPDEKIMYIVQGSSFTGVERLTYAHEFTHALQDQHFNMRNVLHYSGKDCEHDLQRCSALQALIEGDATFTQQQWYTKYATSLDRQQVSSQAGQPSPLYEAAPQYLQQDFLYPYAVGLKYVLALWNNGGWDEVNAAYKKPPISSEQIMHPEKYPEDYPRSIALPDLTPLLGQGWNLLEKDTLGEWYTFLTLAYSADPAARLTQEQARISAAGWKGDQFAVYSNADNDQSAVVLVNQWDTRKDSGEFMDALRANCSARWGEPTEDTPDKVTWENAAQAVTIARNDRFIFWVISPQATTTSAIANKLLVP